MRKTVISNRPAFASMMIILALLLVSLGVPHPSEIALAESPPTPTPAERVYSGRVCGQDQSGAFQRPARAAPPVQVIQSQQTPTPTATSMPAVWPTPSATPPALVKTWRGDVSWANP